MDAGWEAEDLEETIPGEDVRSLGQFFADMTSATRQVLALPQPAQADAIAELNERCRRLGFVLWVQKNSRDQVERAIAVRESTSRAVTGMAGGSSSSLLEDTCLVSVIHRDTGARRMVAMTPSQAEQFMFQSRDHGPFPQVTNAEIDDIQMEALNHASGIRIADPQIPESSHQGQSSTATEKQQGITPSQRRRRRRGGRLPPPRR